MNVVYISETTEVNDVLGKFQKKLPSSIKKHIAKNKIYFKKQQEDIECKVFIGNKFKEKDISNLGQIIKDTITGNAYKTAVLSNKIKEYKNILDKLDGITLLDGHWLFNYMVYDIVNYILQKENKQINNSEISILVNNTTQTNVENILTISQKAKILNIVTENISAFKQIEEKLFEEKGIAIRVTNNKKRVLLKSDVIINLDFNEEELRKYSIPSRRNYSKCKQTDKN